MWNWTYPDDALLLLGWIAAGYLAGVLKWRPHVWITGGSGCGKTTLQETIAEVIYRQYGIYLADTRNTSSAGIRQLLGYDARPVLLDEAEGHTASDIKGLKLQDILLLMRAASSSAGIGTIKGTPDGKGMAFSLRGSFSVASINPPDFEPADQSRIAMLELDPLESNKPHIPVLDKNLGDKLWTRMVKHYTVFKSYLEVVKKTLNEVRGDDLRFQDTYGTLIAAALVALSPDITEEQVREKTKSIDLTRHRNVIKEKNDFDEITELILHQIIEVEIPFDYSRSVKKGRYTIAEVAKIAARQYKSDGGRTNDDNPYKQSLALYGLSARYTIPDESGTKMLELFIPNEHIQIRRALRDTRWANGGWHVPLARDKDRGEKAKYRLQGKHLRGYWIKTGMRYKCKKEEAVDADDSDV